MIKTAIETAVLEALKCVGLKYSQSYRLQAKYRDCSSLVARAYIAAGYEWGCRGRPVPRSLEEVYDDGFELIWPTDNNYAVIGKSLPTSASTRKKIDLQRGDLVFCATKGKASSRANKIEHVIMMTDTDRIVHARGSAYGVRKDSISLYDTKLCAVTRFNPTCDLVKGHIGNRVRELQKILNQVLNAGIDVDGAFGGATQKAVEAYQKMWSLPVTGKADTATRASLGIVDEYGDVLPTTRPTLTVGDKGTAVRELQSLLLDRGESLPKFGADGDFGSETYEALVSYQTKQGIAEDGVCGPVTWAHLTGETDDGEETAAEDCYVRVIADKTANVRTLPGSTGEIRGTVKHGAVLKATGGFATENSTLWYNVIYDGESVWISSRMAELVQGISEIAPDDQPEQDTPLYVEKGLSADISKYQGNVNFKKAVKELDFVIARGLCRETVDARIATYTADMKANSLPYGVYNFTYAKTVAEAKRDAKRFYESCEKFDPLYYVLDAEVSTLNQEIILAWLETMRELTDKPIGCYVAHHMYSKYGFKKIRDRFDFVWIPRYGCNDGKQHLKPAYPCDLWQYTSCGKVSGFGGRVDLNVIIPGGRTLLWFRGEDKM